MNKVETRGYWPNEWPDWPEDRKARKAAGSLYKLGWIILNAPASLRKSRLEQVEQKSENHWSQMTEREQERITRLVRIWERNALIQQNIRYEETRMA